MSNPKISVITITFNSEKTVRETFESVRKQGYDNLEYLIVDGGSTDSTLQIAEEYKDIITSVVSEKDNGISDAMNKGIRRASGEIIGIIHSDDMLTEGALQKLAKAYDGKTDVYYGDIIVCAENGELLHRLNGSDRLEEMNYGFCISHPSTFVTKEAYEKYGVYDTSLKCCMDYERFLCMYKAGAVFKHIHEPLAVYRLGGTNQVMRKRTIRESCDVCIRYGGNRFRANYYRIKKTLVDVIRPLAHKLGIHNARVQKLQ